ncbi:MAG TPA: hypothetical protein VEU94_01080 [Terriglobales bacterium]|nr:hypothetical protein [Terriglobales bacterium]
MPVKNADRISHLETYRYRFGPGEAARVVKLLNSVSNSRFADADSLIRFHETLLFLRAFPQGPGVVRKTENLLHKFSERVAELRHRGINLSSWDTFEFSGVAGTSMEDTLSFDVARWLIRRMPGKVRIAWDNYEPGRELGATWPRFMPLLEDDAYVEADTPWRQWLEAAQGRKRAGPEWLLRRIEKFPLSDHDKAELYDSLRLPLRWDIGNARMSRTRNWERKGKLFYHHAPLISRSQVSLVKELTKKPPTLI